MLAIGTWILRGTLFIDGNDGYAEGIIFGGHGVVQNFVCRLNHVHSTRLTFFSGKRPIYLVLGSRTD